MWKLLLFKSLWLASTRKLSQIGLLVGVKSNLIPIVLKQIIKIFVFYVIPVLTKSIFIFCYNLLTNNHIFIFYQMFILVFSFRHDIIFKINQIFLIYK